MLSFILILVWLWILILGAELLIRWSSSISKQFGIPPIVIWLTIVAFGTSAPELIVNVMSAQKWVTDVAIWNIVGSNIGNILLILWISVLFWNLPVQKNTVWKEIPFAILASIVLYFVANDVMLNGDAINVISRNEWFILLCFFAIFLYYTFYLTFSNEKTLDDTISLYHPLLAFAMIIWGLMMLFFGGNMLVDNSVDFALLLWIPEIVIWLTIIAIGTSMPELVTCILAVKRKQADIVIWNLVGSNIFNTFWILWFTSTISPLGISNDALFDIKFALTSSFLVFLFLFAEKWIYEWTHKKWINNIIQKNTYILKAWHWVILVSVYVTYIVYLVVR